MASPHKRRRKRAIADLLGGTIGSAALVKEALEYMIFGGGSKGKSSLVADGASADPSKVDALLGNAEILSSMSQLDTKYLAHLGFAAPADMNGDWIKIGDKYFVFDDAKLPALTGTTVSLNHDGDAGTADVTAVVVGTKDEAEDDATCATQLKAAIESVNGFGSKMSASIEAAGGADELLLSWSPRTYGALSITQGAGDSATITKSTGRGGSIGGHAPIHYLKAAAPGDYTGDRGVLFFINGPASKYIQNSADMLDSMVANIKPTSFPQANRALHIKFVASMATGDAVVLKALDGGAAEDFAATTPVAGVTDLEAFTGSPVLDKSGLDAGAQDSFTLGEYIIPYEVGDVDQGIQLTYTRVGGESAITGGGFALHWEVIDWT